MLETLAATATVAASSPAPGDTALIAAMLCHVAGRHGIEVGMRSAGLLPAEFSEERNAWPASRRGDHIMKQVLSVIEEALNRLRARQMVTEIAVMEIVRALSPQARQTFAERFPVQVAMAIQPGEHLTPTIEDQMASLLMALQQAAGDRPPHG